MLTVTKVQLRNQLADGSATDMLDHLVWLDPLMLVLTEDGPRSAQQTSWFLETGDWVPVFSLCSTDDCIRADHLTNDKAKAEVVKDEELMRLVQRNSVTLASLYRKGKAMGVLSGTSSYG